MTLFLDACALIYLIEAKEPFHGLVIAALRRMRQSHADTRLAVSRLSVLECLVKPVRDGDQGLIDDYRAFFSARDLTMVEITPTVMKTALGLRARTGLRTPDAIQAACALSVADGGCLFLTNDRRIDRVTELRVAVLGDTEGFSGKDGTDVSLCPEP